MSDPYRENSRPTDAPEPKEMSRDETALHYLEKAFKTTDVAAAVSFLGKALRMMIYEHAEYMTAAIRAQEDNAELRHKELLAALGYEAMGEGNTSTLNKITRSDK